MVRQAGLYHYDTVCLRDVDLGVLCPFLSVVFRFRVMVVLSMTIVTKGNQPITK